jgi:hypothetical protein
MQHFPDGSASAVCVSYCDRESEWRCHDECVDKQTACDDNCPKDSWLCKADNKCIPLR